MVDGSTPIALEGDASRFVSRGGDKLDGALDRLGVAVEGRWLDAGASTGGFTDCLLKRGARAVAAVDVGYGQLDWGLRNDARVTVLERTNVRELTPEALPWVADGVVADLSFISLALVLPALMICAAPSAPYVLLIKPQFEVGRDAVGKGGVVRDPELWRSSVMKIVTEAAVLGLGSFGVTHSDPPGPAGNREFFVALKLGARQDLSSLDEAIERAGALV
jgi:23S rRNA (cytidine1920-2'-O)/16S rRNA (cytidine1409-2'-O)-methyltransferase